MPSCQRAWRLLATALGYLVYGLGALLLWYGVYPLSCLWVAPARRPEYARYLSHLAFRWFVEFLAAVGVWCYRIEGEENLKAAGRIIAANHPSFLDIVLLLARLENAVCIVKPGLAALPLVERPIRCCGHLPAVDAQTLVAEAVKVLRSGACLVLFPQGTRTPPGGGIRFQRSVARIALEADAPVVPVYFEYRPLLLGKHQRWYHVPERRPQVQVTAGAEIRPREVAGELPLPRASRRLIRHLEAHFQAWAEHRGESRA